jgi:hypothetical protein
VTEREKSYKALGDMMEELRHLHESIEQKPDEFTADQYFDANPGKFRGIRQAEYELEKLAREGSIDKPPQRLINGKTRNVYRLKTDQKS